MKKLDDLVRDISNQIEKEMNANKLRKDLRLHKRIQRFAPIKERLEEFNEKYSFNGGYKLTIKDDSAMFEFPGKDSKGLPMNSDFKLKTTNDIFYRFNNGWNVGFYYDKHWTATGAIELFLYKMLRVAHGKYTKK